MDQDFKDRNGQDQRPTNSDERNDTSIDKNGPDTERTPLTAANGANRDGVGEPADLEQEILDHEYAAGETDLHRDTLDSESDAEVRAHDRDHPQSESADVVSAARHDDDVFSQTSEREAAYRSNHHERRGYPVLLPVLLSLALLGSIAYGIVQHDRSRQYETYLSGLYNKSFDELVTNMGALETDLSKLLVVTSPQQYLTLFSSVYHTTGQSVGMLGQLPTAYEDYSGLNRFLVQTGDYCFSLSKSVAQGTPLSEADMQQLSSLQSMAARLTQRLREAQDGQTPAFAALAAAGDYFGEGGLSTLSFSSSETDPEDKYPQLIYDGPFSDSTEKLEAKGLGSEALDENAAMAKAREFLGDELSGDLTRIEDENGRIAAFGYGGKTKDGLDLTIFITKQGGKCLSMGITDGATQPDSAAPLADTLKAYSDAGVEYLKAKGFGAMVSTYAQFYNGNVVINYAAVQDDVILYSDLVKLWFNQQTGRILGLDSRNYLFSHVARTIPRAEISAAEAQLEVSESLEIQSIKLAFIPLSATVEKLCYEFKCKYGEDSYIVYIDALSGMEEQIFRIIDSENGQLVL